MTDYEKVAWCTEISPSSHEYFEKLAIKGVAATVICLHISGLPHAVFSAEQTKASRAAGLVTNAFAITDLVHPTRDAKQFIQRFKELEYDKFDVRVAIMPIPDETVPNPEERIREYIATLRSVIDRNDIDLCFQYSMIDNGEIDLDLLPSGFNLTVAHYGGLDAGIPQAGTWIYTNCVDGEPQLIAYDFFQYYTHPHLMCGFQMNLSDEYVARPGDNRWLIAQYHGMSVLDLLERNHATLDDRILPGQHIQLA